MPTRSPEEIRLSVQETRRELEFSLNDLQAKVTDVTDWRGQRAEHRQPIVIGGAVAGFVIGGGIGAALGVFKRG